MFYQCHGGGERAPEAPDNPVAAPAERLRGGRQHPQGGDGRQGLALVAIKPERGFQGGQGQLVDPNRPEQRMPLDRLHQRPFAGDDPGLGATQQFVAAERDQIGPGSQILPDGRLAVNAVGDRSTRQPLPASSMTGREASRPISASWAIVVSAVNPTMAKLLVWTLSRREVAGERAER